MEHMQSEGNTGEFIKGTLQEHGLQLKEVYRDSEVPVEGYYHPMWDRPHNLQGQEQNKNAEHFIHNLLKISRLFKRALNQA